MKEKLNGYWLKKDGSCRIFVEKVFKKGYVTGFRYFLKDGKELIDLNPFKCTHEELKEGYERRV